MKLVKFKKINKKLNFSQLKDIISILNSENRTSILSKLSKKNLTRFIQQVIKSNYLELFVVTKRRIIGYAILAKKPDYLLKSFKKFQLEFCFNLFLNFKFLTIFNIFISILNFDKILISDLNKKIISESLNLNLLGINKEYQSRAIGKKFLEYIFKYSIHKSKYVTCETDNIRSNSFYKKKLNFKSIGKKIRFLKNQDVLAKKL